LAPLPLVSGSVLAGIPRKSQSSNEQTQKEVEEERLREEYKQKLEAEKQKAIQEAEREIEEEKQRQRMILEARKQAEIAKWTLQSRIGFREKLKQEEAQARRIFERRLSLQAYRLLRAGVKRPQVEAWKQRQKAEFYRQLTVKRQEAIQQFETKLQEKLPEVEQNLTKQIESALSAWEESAKQQLELSIEEWEKQAWQKFETELLPQLKESKEAEAQQKTWTETLAESFITPFELGMAIGEKITGETIPKEMKEQLIPPHEKGMKSAVIGVSASLESFLKGIGHISIEAFIKGPGKEFIPPTEMQSQVQALLHEALGPSPPTLSGAVTGSFISKLGYDVGAEIEWARLVEMERKYPGYIAGTIMGDILISWMTGKAFSKAWQKIRGAKIKRIVAAEEYEFLKVTPEEGKIEAISRTKPYIRYERVSAEVAEQIDEALKFFEPEEIHLAGEQIFGKAELKAKESLIRISQAEATRRVEPFISAVMEQPSISAEWAKHPLISEWRISIYSPKELTKIEKLLETVKRIFVTKQPSSEIITKTKISSPLIAIEYKAPVEQYMGKLFTGIQITGKMTPEAYAKVSKALPSAFRQIMGGITAEQITKQLITSPKMIKVATDIVGIEYPSTFLPKLLGVSALAFKAPTWKEIRKQTVTPSIKQYEFNMPTAKDIAKQFEKASEKVVSEINLSQSLKLEQVTTQTFTEHISVPKVKIPSEPFKIKSKRKKGKLSPLFYGWGWMISPVMEPPEVMKLMLRGGKK